MAVQRPSRRAPLLLAAALILAACADEDPDSATESTTTTVTTTTTATDQPVDEASLPPGDFESLAAIFEPRYEPLGMRLTRASVVEIDGGAHLQLYVEPTEAVEPQQYLDSIVPTTAAVVPFIFDEWPELASFDVCQEPPPGVDDRVAPEQVTVVALTRDQAESLDWPDPDLTELMSAVIDAERIGEVRGNDAVEALPDFQAARAAAGG